MEETEDVIKLKCQIEELKGALPLINGKEKDELQLMIHRFERFLRQITNSEWGSSSSEGTNSQSSSDGDMQVGLDEYDLFTSEIAALEQTASSSSTFCPVSSKSGQAMQVEQSDLEQQSVGVLLPAENSTDNNTDIQNELSALEGMKCLAPHEEGWGQIGYYPAMISEVVRYGGNDAEIADPVNCMSEIKVRVFFFRPVVQSQLVCPFYKEDRCRFSDNDCKFSHGEIVPFSQIRDYSEPDYSKIIPSAKVLAKHHDDLWYPAIVTKLTSTGNCEVHFDKTDEILQVGIHETVHVDDLDEYRGRNSEDELELEEESNDDQLSEGSLDNVIDSDILKINSSDALGDWEKHTKGFGSKLMMKMGYIIGTGLGKNAEGRVVPVDAVMIPHDRMSLDTFMEFKEQRKMGNHHFSVEKRLRRAHQRHAMKEQNLSDNQKKSTCVFQFMNSQLFASKNTKSQPSSSVNVAQKPSTLLRKETLIIGGELKKIDKDIAKLKESIKRVEGRDSVTQEAMRSKLGELENRKNELIRLENVNVREQQTRLTKKKLMEF